VILVAQSLLVSASPPGASVHSPLSMFICVLAPLATDLPTDINYIKNTKEATKS